MSTLIVTLPARAADAAGYAYVLTPDGRSIEREGNAPLALLPAAGRANGDLVAVVPVQRLSWHAIALPRGTSIGSPRLRAVIDGLLEDRLLDETSQLHFAMAPGARAGTPVWVAVCDKAWLRDALRVLDATQRPLVRVVPEFWPGSDEGVLHAIGEPEDALLISTSASGLRALPLSSAGLGLAQAAGAVDDATSLVAEPAVASLAEQLLQRQASLRTPAQRALEAALSPWDLLQFDLASSGRSRALKRMHGGWQAWLRAPQWRAVRWGAVALVAINLIGINAMAWKERAALAHKRDEVRSVLMQAFPGTKVVVDAPVQMEREVAALRQATGATSGGDLETILGALGSSLPPERAVSAIEYAAGEMRLRGLDLGEAELSQLSTQLQGRGFSVRADGASVVVRPQSLDGTPNGGSGGRS